MKPSRIPRPLGLQILALASGFAFLAAAQDRPLEQKPPAEPPKAATATESSAVSTNSVAATNAVPDSAQKAANAGASPSTQPADRPASGTNSPAAASDEIQLSLQGANVDMVAQWLAQNTGKAVLKHPRVQCQVTITTSKKLGKREAITLVYRALALEGFTATETASTIILTPEGQEPKISPELIDPNRKDIPEGRQRLVKIFPLAHMQAADMRERIRGALSEKGAIEIDERANQLVVTDLNENLSLLGELIRQFDAADSDLAIQIFPLKFADADETANFIGLIVNVPAAGSSSPSRGGASPGAGSPPPGGPPSPSGGASPPVGQSSAPLVRIWPDKTANRLIVSGVKSRLEEVQRLVEILDADKPQDVRVRVIALKNVAAADLVREIAPLYQKLGGRTRKDVVEVGANDRSNSLIVLSSEANFLAVQELIKSLDTDDAQEKVVRTFILKNADAQDVAKQLQDLTREQDNNSPFRFVYFGGSSGDRDHKKMSVVADRRRNSIVVQAPPNQMESVAKIIKELDEPITDNSLAPRIFHLKYVNAVDIEDVLNELFLKKTQQRSYFFYDDYQEPQADRDVGRLYGKVRITSEPYSNTLIITSNSKENLAVVEDVLNQLDSPSDAGESTLRVGLKYAKASTVANNINILFAKNGSPPLRPQGQQGQQGQQPQQNQQQQSQNGAAQAGFDLEQVTKEEGYFPWIGGQPDNPRGGDARSVGQPVSDLVGRVRAVADLRSNALLISANVHYFPQVMKLVQELDAATDQVLIEARLVEVSTDFLDSLGVRYSPNGSQVFTAQDYDNSIMIHSGGQYQQGFGGKTTVNTPSTGGSVAQALTSLRSGVLDSTISMDFLIQFLRLNTDAKVLAEPQINIRDNETGKLFVGQQVPIPQSSVFSGVGSQNTTFTYKDVGVVLEVSPHINSTGDVELRIHAESSTVVAGETVLGGSVFDTRNFRTDLTAKNGETLVLGGIIQKQVQKVVRKTPILGDIPGLGWAFKKRDQTSHEVELMVFMRPRVTRTPMDASDLLNETYRRSPKIKEWDDESHGVPKPPPPPKAKKGATATP